MKHKNQKGFSLIETIVGMGVFLLFAVGIYGSLQFVFKVVGQSKLRILETGILNEQIEIVRNLPFEDVGIILGSPSGVLIRTVTTTRNGTDFTITRTIRNIDDPFDGTIDGTPKDIVPADYKVVDIEIMCNRCPQKTPLRMSTQVAPKLLEGDPTHGALFVEVFDSEAKPVVGASVHIVATSTSPAVDFVDTTDNNGMLRVVDLGAGTDAYDITVTKTGYTTDQTRRPTTDNPNPVKSLASVQAQNVTELSFTIDLVAEMDISATNIACNPNGIVPIQVLGTKVIGTEPDVLKINQTINTSAGGTYNFGNLDVDSYGLKISNYDLVGSIPALPISLSAGAVQPIQLILGTNTANSLLINVVDSITLQPLSNATVHLTGTGYDKSKITGVGFMGQTDWSGGTGQEFFSDETKYYGDDGKIENNNLAGDVKLRKVGQNYVSSGQLESSIFDLGLNVNFVNLFWTPLSQSVETGANSVKFQVATAVSSTPETWEYVGYDGTDSTYFDAEHQVFPEILNGKRYFRYRLFLSTETTTSTPFISDVNFTYVTSCTPPGQTYFGGLSEQIYTIEIVRDGYQTKTEQINLSGDIIFSAEMVAE